MSALGEGKVRSSARPCGLNRLAGITLFVKQPVRSAAVQLISSGVQLTREGANRHQPGVMDNVHASPFGCEV